MACRTCPDCGIDFPPAEAFHACIACGMVTKYRPLHAQDLNWRQQAEMIAARITAVVDEELREITHLDVPVKLDDEGLFWISSHDAIRSGASNNLADQDVISVGDPDNSPNGPDNNLYEVIAYVESKRSYWIRPLVVPDHG